MTQTVPDVLARIVAHKREHPAAAQDLPDWERRAVEAILQRRHFAEALAIKAPAIIAEIKKASPSKGLLARDFDPVRMAVQYEAGGASALSVLTDEAFFQGSLADLQAARAATSLPALRKDFTLGTADVLQAAAGGADAILLIASILSDRELRDLRESAARYRIAALVEVHDAAELDRAVDSGAEIIGVNNRDLTTFEVSLDTSLRLAERVPAGVIKVSESGIRSADDVARLRNAGYHAFLVGEHLMKSHDPATALRALVNA